MVRPRLAEPDRTSFSASRRILFSSRPSSRANGFVSAWTSMKALPRAMPPSYGFGPFFLLHDRIHGVEESPLLIIEVNLALPALRDTLDVGDPGGFLLRIDPLHDPEPDLVKPPRQTHPHGPVHSDRLPFLLG